MENMVSRGKRSDSQVNVVDVRQAPMALLMTSSKTDAGRVADRIVIDGTIAGSTDFALMTIGLLDGTKLEVSIQPMFNGGSIGSPVVVTPASSTAGVSTISVITTLSDDQIAYMTSADITISTAGATPSFPTGTWDLYLLKKVVLG